MHRYARSSDPAQPPRAVRAHQNTQGQKTCLVCTGRRWSLLEVQCSRQPHKNDSSLSKLGCKLLLFWLSFLSLITQKVSNQGWSIVSIDERVQELASVTASAAARKSPYLQCCSACLHDTAAVWHVVSNCDVSALSWHVCDVSALSSPDTCLQSTLSWHVRNVSTLSWHVSAVCSLLTRVWRVRHLATNTQTDRLGWARWGEGGCLLAPHFSHPQQSPE